MPLKTNTPEQREEYRIYMREYHKKRYQTDPEYKTKHVQRVKDRQAIKKLEKEQEQERERELEREQERHELAHEIDEPYNNEVIE
jgi:hypothetical protein